MVACNIIPTIPIKPTYNEGIPLNVSSSTQY